MPTPDDVYREFGKAAEQAQHFESALGTILLVCKIFENEAKSESNLQENYYQDLLARIDRNTLGALLRKVSERVAVPADYANIFESALRIRNYLIHGFYREYDSSFETTPGRDTMVIRLAESHKQLGEAREAAERLLRTYVRDQGPPPGDPNEA